MGAAPATLTLTPFTVSAARGYLRCAHNHETLAPGTVAFENQEGLVVCAGCAAHATICTDPACGHPRYVYAATAGRPLWCFWIPVEPHDENGWVPSVATEGEPGHAPLAGKGSHARPWYWGKSYEQAREVCAAANARIGITPQAACEIVLSSLSAGRP
jgi:hypothetical protein